MPISFDSLAQTTLAGLPLLPLIRDVLYGILGLILVLLYHGSAINFIILRFERLTNENLKYKQYNRVFFHFYASFSLLPSFTLLK